MAGPQPTISEAPKRNNKSVAHLFKSSYALYMVALSAAHTDPQPLIGKSEKEIARLKGITKDFAGKTFIEYKKAGEQIDAIEKQLHTIRTKFNPVNISGDKNKALQTSLGSDSGKQLEVSTLRENSTKTEAQVENAGKTIDNSRLQLKTSEKNTLAQQKDAFTYNPENKTHSTNLKNVSTEDEKLQKQIQESQTSTQKAGDAVNRQVHATKAAAPEGAKRILDYRGPELE